MNLKKDLLSLIIMAVCLTEIILLSTICAPCAMGMICKKSVAICKILLCIAGCSQLLNVCMEKKAMYIVSNILTILFGIGCFLTTNVIVGGCKMMDMACRMKSFPSIYVVIIILAILSVINCLIHLKNKVSEI